MNKAAISHAIEVTIVGAKGHAKAREGQTLDKELFFITRFFYSGRSCSIFPEGRIMSVYRCKIQAQSFPIDSNCFPIDTVFYRVCTN
jgi:hypothetical protein